MQKKERSIDDEVSDTSIQSRFFPSYEYELLIKVAWFKHRKFPCSMCIWFLDIIGLIILSKYQGNNLFVKVSLWLC